MAGLHKRRRLTHHNHEEARIGQKSTSRSPAEQGSSSLMPGHAVIDEGGAKGRQGAADVAAGGGQNLSWINAIVAFWW